MRLHFGGLAILWVALGAPAYGGERDQQIATEVAQTLKQSGKLTNYEVAVKFRDGTARLEGWVSNQKQMNEALSIVQASPQVDRVINMLQVREGNPAAEEPTRPTSSGPVLRQTSHQKPASGPSASSSSPNVANLVAQNFKQSGALNRYQISVRYDNGVAELHGWVSSNEQKLIAEEIAQQTQGVDRVFNYLTPKNERPMQSIAHRQQQPTLRPVANRQDGQQGPPPQAAPGGYPQGGYPGPYPNAPQPEYVPGMGGGPAPVLYDQAYMPNYSWPSYAAYPNYAAISYPQQYSPTAWPYIGPFYPYPQVPLGWRKVTLEWDDGWWFLNYADDRRHVKNQ